MNQPGHQAQRITVFDPKRCVGIVAQSGLAAVRVQLDSVNGNGSHGPGCQVGDYLIIQCGKMGIFGQVNDVSLSEGEPQLPMGTVQLMTTVDTSSGSISPGVGVRPNIGNSAFLADPQLVKHIIETRFRKNGTEPQVALNFARLADASKTPITLTPEMIFGRHCAILGTTGGGKSYSIARLVEEMARHRSKVILFDASGEFDNLGGPTLHVYLGKHPNPREGLYEVVLPYYQLIESDLFAIFKPTGEGQAPKLRAAIKSLKLALLAPQIALDGTIVKANKAKQAYENEYMRHVSQIERPDANFNVLKLVRQIANECVHPNRSTLEPTYWGDINGLEMSLCTPLINRVQDIISSPNLAPIFEPGDKPPLFGVIERFLAHDSLRVLCISLQYLSFAHNAREIIANAAGRYLLEIARAERFQKSPVVVVVDEAHQFLKDRLNDLPGEFALDAFGLIAKEGRKYALNICISTQRPRDIPESVLSQMGTLIVHRLINDRDRAIIERASGEADRSALNALPVLTQGKAVILGADFQVPLLIQVEPPQSPPISKGPDYQRFWR